MAKLGNKNEPQRNNNNKLIKITKSHKIRNIVFTF